MGDGGASDTEDEAGAWGLFDEPDGFRPKTPPPTEVVQRLHDGSDVRLRLVGSHPLWGHYLWNAAPTMATYLQEHADRYVRGRALLELGAAAGLPSIAADRAGAAIVVATDYPDPDLMQNLAHNLTHNACTHATAHGYIWGADAAPLRALVPHDYDVVLMSDLIFNHQAHEALLDTCDACLTRDAARAPCALVFFSHHRPHLAEKDAHFFTRAGARGYGCEKIGEWHLEVCTPRGAKNAAHVSRRPRGRARASHGAWLAAHARRIVASFMSLF